MTWYFDVRCSKPVRFPFGLILGSITEKSISKSYMKQLFRLVVDFLRKEWFLLVAIAAISLIILLFEFL